VAMALLESSFENFQHTALLLSTHTDVLCEYMHNGCLEEHVVLQDTRGDKCCLFRYVAIWMKARQKGYVDVSYQTIFHAV
jgi:hypothetical protein